MRREKKNRIVSVSPQSHSPFSASFQTFRLTARAHLNTQKYGLFCSLIRLVLPFKDQKSANSVRRQLGDLSRKINVDISPVYTSRKIKDEIKVRENNPPLVNQQCVVYNFQCNLCDAGYVGYTCRHLHQRIEEHKGSAIGNHLKEEHDIAPDDIAQFFKILKKCQSKFDCLIFEMFFIKELKPTLNKQCDSIRAKLFV